MKNCLPIITAVGLLLLIASVVPLAFAPFPPGPPRTPFDQWMTGGGFVDTENYGRVTHGFVIRCQTERMGNNLEVNWGGNSFHMTELTNVNCWDDPTIEPDPPKADFDTIHGDGMGGYNGQDGATVHFMFTDAGEPGTGVDRIKELTIRDASGQIVLDMRPYPGRTLDGGNHQAHEATPKDNV